MAPKSPPSLQLELAGTLKPQEIQKKKTSTRISGSALRLHYWDVQSSLSISRLAGQFRHHFLFLVFLSKDRGNISSQYASLAHAKRQKLGNENHIQNLSSKSFPVGTRNVSLSQATQVLRSYLFLQVLQGTKLPEASHIRFCNQKPQLYSTIYCLVGGFNFPENICSSLENHPLKMVETMNSSNHQPDHDAFRGEKNNLKNNLKNILQRLRRLETSAAQYGRRRDPALLELQRSGHRGGSIALAPRPPNLAAKWMVSMGPKSWMVMENPNLNWMTGGYPVTPISGNPHGKLW